MKSAFFTKKTIVVVAGTALGMFIAAMLLSYTLIAQYTGSGNHIVAMTDAQRYIQNYRNNPVVPANKAVYFERNIYDKILAQPGCVGVRQYFATNTAGSVTLVLVGVDAKGNDIVSGVIGEGGMLCPPYCAPDTKLY